MKTIFRCLCRVMAVLAFLTGVTVQATPRTVSVESGMAMGLPGNKISELLKAGDVSEQLPCDDIHSGCAGELSDLEVPNLPPTPVIATPVIYVAVVYWHLPSLPPGLSHRPPLLPPIGI
jgi:hypothetical protein